MRWLVERRIERLDVMDLWPLQGAAAQAASVIGKQTSDTFTKWRTKAGRAFDPVVKYGIVDKEEYVGRYIESSGLLIARGAIRDQWLGVGE
jgi:hypothetical protein